MKLLSALGKVLAFGCALAFVVLLPVSLLTDNVQQHLMKPDLYKHDLAEQEVYSQFPSLLADELTKAFKGLKPEEAADPGMQALTEMIQSLDEEDWQYILTTLLPEDWAQTQFESILDELFAFLDGDTESLDTAVSLEELKINFAGPEGVLVLERLIQALSPCTGADLFTFILGALTSDSPNIPVCAPPKELLGDNLENLQFLLPLAAEQIPDTIPVHLTLEDFEIQTQDEMAGQSNLVVLYRQVREVSRWSMTVSIALLVLILILAVRSMRALAFWWGWPLTIGSAVALLPAALRGQQMIDWFAHFVEVRIPAVVSPEISAIMVGVVRELSGTLREALIRDAAVFLLLGVAILVLGFALKFRQKETSAEEPHAEEESDAVAVEED